MEFLRSLLEWVVSLLGPFVAPDWGALIKLIPLGVLAIVVAFYGWVFWRFRRAGPRRISMPTRTPRTCAGEMPCSCRSASAAQAAPEIDFV